MENEGKWYYSLSERGFYFSKDIDTYKSCGTLPTDLCEISQSKYDEYWSGKEGYYQVFDGKGPRLEKIDNEENIRQYNLLSSKKEYDRASQRITYIQQRIDDEDYDDVNTESAVASSKSKWTTYRKALRAYIAAEDGSQDLPKAPDA